MRKEDPKRFRLLLLSDLHFCASGTDSKILKWYLPGRSEASIGWALTNIERLFDFILEGYGVPLPDHVVILGDMTTRGLSEEFALARRKLLHFQKGLQAKRKVNTCRNDRIDPDLFTVIPGNHDLTKLTKTTIGCFWDTFLGFLRRRLRLERTRRSMPPLLREFDKYFGETLSDDDMRPPLSPEQFGSYEKQLPGTNIRLVPLHSCVALPVTAVGWNARGCLDSKQLGNLSRLEGQGLGIPEPFRLAVMHHFPLPIPLNREHFTEDFHDFERSNEIVSDLYQSSKVALILCGHKHTDFIWNNSTNVPDVERCMPIVTLGSATFTPPDERKLRFCLLEVEDRNIGRCSAETSFVTIGYYAWRPGGGAHKSGAEEFCCRPSYYREFTNETLRHVEKARANAHAGIVSFVDFSGAHAQQLANKKILEAISHGGEQACLELSRWGLRVYGTTDGLGEEFLIDVGEERIAGPLEIELSFRRVPPPKGGPGTPEIQVICGEPKPYVIVDETEKTWVARLDRFDENAHLRVRFRSRNEPSEVVFHYLLVRKL